MQKGNLSIQKTEWRIRFEKKRESISLARRVEASRALLNHIPEKGNILSFCSFGSEIDLFSLNQTLADHNRLLLPRIERDDITPYRVNRLEDLIKSISYRALEPNPSLCLRGDLSQIAAILVPGLVFDAAHYRLGYGKGFYDRFLLKVKGIRSIGVGFREQLSREPVPRDSWDVPVNDLLLV